MDLSEIMEIVGTEVNAREFLEKALKATEGSTGVQRLVYGLYLAASTDPLTKVPNRRHFNERLEDERRLSYQNGLGVILFDIDNFHEYNRKNGESQGDIALSTVARIIAEQTRFEDVIRYGGEEILVLCPGAGLDETKTVAERIRESVESQQIPFAYFDKDIFPLDPGYEHVTVTAAVSTLNRGESDIVKAIIKADKKLGEGKEIGRNKVYS
ncbi:MAG: GGDEF domain-containing protein [Nanoarchaeota archaeon]|nr:GGDEF domain-containing protein [Nanoarchaeota archaeon]MBU1445513.1 GGDEF domain-containing protein [Nanoarchaeota archaeon]MBU2406998.1 GGDEF domain-containing protein [Nanoarchaeota archaeon]MBU2420612.1 GGDEF domain-containing protein [Nanoarchaeota archaeon]MBU2474940.1 GGDEF domain-containing protein [Nanoarchaeota archaeon]